MILAYVKYSFLRKLPCTNNYYIELLKAGSLKMVLVTISIVIGIKNRWVKKFVLNKRLIF